jgi:hypothetical protein
MPLSGTFKEEAAKQGLTPVDYALQLVRQYGNVTLAAKGSGYSRATLMHHIHNAGFEVKVKTSYSVSLIKNEQ